MLNTLHLGLGSYYVGGLGLPTAFVSEDLKYSYTL